MKVGTGGNLGLSREYHKKLFGPMFYSWYNCPLNLDSGLDGPKKEQVSWQHSLSQDLDIGCPNRGFIDFWVSKVWYKVHTTNEINPIQSNLY